MLLAAPNLGPLQPWFAVIGFILVCLTDFVDGLVARKMNQETTLGKFLDPLADKILVITILLFFVEEARIAYSWVAIIVIRELVVSALRTFAALENQVIKADQLGKAKTVWQYITIVWMIMAWPGETLFIYIMVLLTIISGVNYFWVNREVLKNG
jgi:CDP-diacylglycerol--glycerol-3-phosphate 3-phosphatidyltransferase